MTGRIRLPVTKNVLITESQMPTQSILESRQEIAKLDKSNMLGSIEALDKQIEHAWEDVKLVEFQPAGQIANVVVSGMGGSGLGADVIKHLFKDSLSVPFEIVNSYTLPAYVNNNTLVLLASYSGNTEETLSCAEEARRKNAQIMVLASGGKLAEFARQYRYPAYIIDPVHNPSGQPRMAIGYAIFGAIGLMSKAGVIELKDEEVKEVTATIRQGVEANTVEVPAESNPAKSLAFTMLDRQPIIITSEFLQGAAHVATNQHNENAKIQTDYKIVPEINHHMMEGLRFPKLSKDSQVFIFVQSQLFRPENSIRMNLTQQIVETSGIDTMTVLLRSQTKLNQVFEMITLFSFAGFYMAVLEGIDPSPIPIVDQFKDELAKYRQKSGLN